MDWLADFLEYIAADKGCSPLTVQSYGVALRQFREFFTGLDATWTWTDVDADVVRRWVAARRAEGIHPHSLQRSLSALRTFYRYLIRTDRAVRNPAYGVRNPKAGKSLPAFVRPKEMDRLLDHTTFPDDFFGRRDHLILLLLYSTGVRRAELVGLNVGDVDLASSELKVTGKRNKQRIIPFGTELCEALRSYISELSERPCSDSSLTSSAARPLFPSKRGSRISPDSVERSCTTTSPWSRASAAAHRTSCATALPPPCSMAAPTSKPCARCWDTRACARPRFTPTPPLPNCAASMQRHTPATTAQTKSRNRRNHRATGPVASTARTAKGPCRRTNRNPAYRFLPLLGRGKR